MLKILWSKLFDQRSQSGQNDSISCFEKLRTPWYKGVIYGKRSFLIRDLEVKKLTPFPRIIPELFFHNHTWNIPLLSLYFNRITPGISRTYPWNILYISLDYSWIISGFPFNIPRLLLVYPHNSRGLFRKYPWITPG